MISLYRLCVGPLSTFQSLDNFHYAWYECYAVGGRPYAVLLNFLQLVKKNPCLWVPVTTAWRILRLWMEEWPPIWRVAANKLNKQSRTADKGWSSSLGLGEALTTPPRKKIMLRNTHGRDASSGDKTIRR